MKGITSMKNNKIVSIAKVGSKGQIVIPVEVRELFDINPGDSLVVLADKNKGIALVKSDVIEGITERGNKDE